MVVTLIDTLYDTCIRFVVSCVSVYYPEDVDLVEEKETVTHEVSIPRTEEGHTFKKVGALLEERAEPEALHNAVMYAQHQSVPVYAQPTVEFDSEIGTIAYGEMVMTIGPKGRFMEIVWGNGTGWVAKSDLADRAAFVYPDFRVGEAHEAGHENTIRVRSILQDIFHAHRLEMPLTSGEYVLYKLWRKGKKVVWGRITGPRFPGLWHKILRGKEGVHIGVAPKVGSIMEYLMDNEMGHVAYVEAVYPDNAISISEANYPDSGIYSERVLTREEWRELRPTFITIL